MYCAQEEFRYGKPPHITYWNRTAFDQFAALQDQCFLSNGLIFKRKCLLRQMRAEWEAIPPASQIRCTPLKKDIATNESQILHTDNPDLKSIQNEILTGRRHLNESQERRNVSASVRRILRQKKHRLEATDVHISSTVFGALQQEAKDAALSSDMLSVCSEVMASQPIVLRQSATELNATNSLLYQFESYMDALPDQLVPHQSCGRVAVASFNFSSEEETGVESRSFTEIGVQALMSNNLSVFFVNPTCDNISGIAIYSKGAPQLQLAHGGFWYRFVHTHETVTLLKEEPNLEAATFLNQQLLEAVQHDGGNYLVFKVYANDALFVERATERKRRPRSKVLSISIPNYAAQLPYKLPFLLRTENQQSPEGGCGYWNYETWLTDGVETTKGNLSDVTSVCYTSHLTQFTSLVGGNYRINADGQEVLIAPLHAKVLDIISIVGCCLSLFGLLGIWLTAAISKRWRNQSSTKVLLHLCLALTLQMVLFVFLNTDDTVEHLITTQSYDRCVILGALLQYSVLVLFSWMLIIAFLQFQRYVTVIGINRPDHYVLKAAVVAWTMPLLPTLLVALIDPTSYYPSDVQLQTDTGICYPTGYGLIFGVVLPVTLITIANLIIFVYVFYSITHSLGQTLRHTERDLVIKQIRLSVLLFFLLGLSWIFGIFAFMQAGVVFSYLFCLTATLQGFVLFVYFVLLDADNRRSWLGLFCPKQKTDVDLPKSRHELQSLTTSSTNYSRRSHH
ncbi:adhesion G-protein coupled receptor G7-like [Scaptodrosophila lebanonensis]|uniref:Adhesion G-protein coupled receptor G7-like n=1 Tax=Drosophila lebanonensis TaxID=7225 RepID=A0A6J2T1N4_DROLE|nr:adhesion G-protein coupled receptor G7-like [Scaptodrosophila lebanonensis]